jgi:hypothetical protein
MKVTRVILAVLVFCSFAVAAERYTVPLENSPQLGPQNAPVTIIEFIDFQ